MVRDCLELIWMLLERGNLKLQILNKYVESLIENLKNMIRPGKSATRTYKQRCLLLIALQFSRRLSQIKERAFGKICLTNISIQYAYIDFMISFY